MRASRATTILVVALLIAGCNGSPSSSPSPSEEPTATPAASEAAIEKEPAATVDELLDRLYAALNEKDSAALAALVTPDAWHSVYFTDGATGQETAKFQLEGEDLATNPYVSVEVTGDFLMVGNAVAIPVEYTYTGEVDAGFDLLSVVPVAGGLLLGSGYTIYGSPGLTVDPAALDAIAANVAAWNADDADGVLATYAEDMEFWDGTPPEEEIRSGDVLAAWVPESLWFDVEITAEQLTSGTFVASPNRLVADAGDTSEGISIFWVRDGLIVLQVFLLG